MINCTCASATADLLTRHPPNVALAAVARELAGFVWDLAQMTPITATVQAT